MNSPQFNGKMVLPSIVILCSERDDVESIRSYLVQHGYPLRQITEPHELTTLNEDEAVIFWDHTLIPLDPAILTTLHQNQTTSVILMGSDPGDSLAQQAAASELYDYLLKPINPHALALVLKRVVTHWRLSRANFQHHSYLHQVQQQLLNQQQIEAALRESEERYRTLIEKSPDAIYLLYNGKFEVINSRFTEIFGVSLADAQAPDFVFTNIISPKGHDWPAARNKDALTSQNESPRYEFVGLNREGEEIELELYVSYLPYKNGLATQGILRDITERKHLERQLNQSQKMEAIGRLAGGVAHDFNNILTVISGLTALGLRRIATDDPLYHDLTTIQNQTQRAAELVRQLLAFSWQKTLKVRSLNLSHIVQGLAPVLHRTLGDSIKLEINLTEGLPNIQADSNALEQILTNLVLNMQETMPEGGQITIQTQLITLDRGTARLNAEAKPGYYVQLVLTDTGLGMDTETQTRIFEPFYTTNSLKQGVGMGMTVVYGLVKEQEGFIEVNSQPQEGSLFKIYFPGTQEFSSENSDYKKNGNTISGPETILLIEDDQTVRNLVQRVLSRAGYGVVTAEDGQAALELIQANQRRIDLVITDVVMPKMGGNKLFKAICDLGLEYEPQFIFMSGYRQDGIQNEGLLSNVSEANFLSKPFSPSELTEKIRQVLKKEQV
jgi:PAS domain S-box-containing protein